MPNPRFDECAVMKQEAATAAAAAAKGLARGCCVASSGDYVCLKNTEFHSELVRPAGTRRYWFSRRVKRAGRKCSIRTRERWSTEMKRCPRLTAACEDIKDKKINKKKGASEEMWRRGSWNFISVIGCCFSPAGIYSVEIFFLSLSQPFHMFLCVLLDWKRRGKKKIIKTNANPQTFSNL